MLESIIRELDPTGTMRTWCSGGRCQQTGGAPACHRPAHLRCLLTQRVSAAGWTSDVPDHPSPACSPYKCVTHLLRCTGTVRGGGGVTHGTRTALPDVSMAVISPRVWDEGGSVKAAWLHSLSVVKIPTLLWDILAPQSFNRCIFDLLRVCTWVYTQLPLLTCVRVQGQWCVGEDSILHFPPQSQRSRGGLCHRRQGRVIPSSASLQLTAGDRTHRVTFASDQLSLTRGHRLVRDGGTRQDLGGEFRDLRSSGHLNWEGFNGRNAKIYSTSIGGKHILNIDCYFLKGWCGREVALSKAPNPELLT